MIEQLTSDFSFDFADHLNKQTFHQNQLKLLLQDAIQHAQTDSFISLFKSHLKHIFNIGLPKKNSQKFKDNLLSNKQVVLLGINLLLLFCGEHLKLDLNYSLLKYDQIRQNCFNIRVQLLKQIKKQHDYDFLIIFCIGLVIQKLFIECQILLNHQYKNKLYHFLIFQTRGQITTDLFIKDILRKTFYQKLIKYFLYDQQKNKENHCENNKDLKIISRAKNLIEIAQNKIESSKRDIKIKRTQFILITPKKAITPTNKPKSQIVQLITAKQKTGKKKLVRNQKRI